MDFKFFKEKSSFKNKHATVPGIFSAFKIFLCLFKTRLFYKLFQNKSIVGG